MGDGDGGGPYLDSRWLDQMFEQMDRSKYPVDEHENVALDDDGRELPLHERWQLGMRASWPAGEHPDNGTDDGDPEGQVRVHMSGLIIGISGGPDFGGYEALMQPDAGEEPADPVVVPLEDLKDEGEPEPSADDTETPEESADIVHENLRRMGTTLLESVPCGLVQLPQPHEPHRWERPGTLERPGELVWCEGFDWTAIKEVPPPAGPRGPVDLGDDPDGDIAGYDGPGQLPGPRSTVLVDYPGGIDRQRGLVEHVDLRTDRPTYVVRMTEGPDAGSVLTLELTEKRRLEAPSSQAGESPLTAPAVGDDVEWHAGEHHYVGTLSGLADDHDRAVVIVTYTDGEPVAPGERIVPTRLLRRRPTMEELVDASSFGTPAAKAARASVPEEVGRRVARAADQLARRQHDPAAIAWQAGDQALWVAEKGNDLTVVPVVVAKSAIGRVPAQDVVWIVVDEPDESITVRDSKAFPVATRTLRPDHGHRVHDRVWWLTGGGEDPHYELATVTALLPDGRIQIRADAEPDCDTVEVDPARLIRQLDNNPHGDPHPVDQNGPGTVEEVVQQLADSVLDLREQRVREALAVLAGYDPNRPQPEPGRLLAEVRHRLVVRPIGDAVLRAGLATIAGIPPGDQLPEDQQLAATAMQTHRQTESALADALDDVDSLTSMRATLRAALARMAEVDVDSDAFPAGDTREPTDRELIQWSWERREATRRKLEQLVRKAGDLNTALQLVRRSLGELAPAEQADHEALVLVRMVADRISRLRTEFAELAGWDHDDPAVSDSNLVQAALEQLEIPRHPGYRIGVPPEPPMGHLVVLPAVGNLPAQEWVRTLSADSQRWRCLDHGQLATWHDVFLALSLRGGADVLVFEPGQAVGFDTRHGRRRGGGGAGPGRHPDHP